MARTKKRRAKRHNLTLRNQRVLSNIRAWMWESQRPDDDCEFILHAAKWMPPFGWAVLEDFDLVKDLFERPRNWVICARAVARAPDGVAWMEQADITLTNRALNSIEGAYDTLREMVVSAMRKDQIYDCGWIAQSWFDEDPADADPTWVYHDAPPGLCPTRVTSRGVRPMQPVGEDWTEERRARWQEYHKQKTLEHRNE